MFFRKNPNASGSQSNQIIQKINGRYKGVKTIGSATTWQEIEKLENLAKQEVERLSGNQYKLFCFESDAYIKYAFAVLKALCKVLHKAFRMSKTDLKDKANLPQIAKPHRSPYLHIVYSILCI